MPSLEGKGEPPGSGASSMQGSTNNPIHPDNHDEGSRTESTSSNSTQEWFLPHKVTYTLFVITALLPQILGRQVIIVKVAVHAVVNLAVASPLHPPKGVHVRSRRNQALRTSFDTDESSNEDVHEVKHTPESPRREARQATEMIGARGGRSRAAPPPCLPAPAPSLRRARSRASHHPLLSRTTAHRRLSRGIANHRRRRHRLLHGLDSNLERRYGLLQLDNQSILPRALLGLLLHLLLHLPEHIHHLITLLCVGLPRRLGSRRIHPLLLVLL